MLFLNTVTAHCHRLEADLFGHRSMGLPPSLLCLVEPPLLQVPVERQGDKRLMEVSFLTTKQLLSKSHWGLSFCTGLACGKAVKIMRKVKCVIGGISMKRGPVPQHVPSGWSWSWSPEVEAAPSPLRPLPGHLAANNKNVSAVGLYQS